MRFVDFLERYQKHASVLAEQFKEIEATETSLIELVRGMIEETKYFNERVYDL